jgi:two-component system, LytTR family, sensor kinase
MSRTLLQRGAIALLTWLPFFAIWTLVTMSFGRFPLSTVLASSLISMGSAGLLGIGVWYACKRWPWPLGFKLRFYLLQIVLALLYGTTWTATICLLEYARGATGLAALLTWPGLARQTMLGVWFYAVLAGIGHAVQTRNRLHDKEILAARAEALASAARLEALRSRLNPHFLFNALHTLSALVSFRPALAQTGIERLGDMLRYTLKEDSRGLVEFSEEFDFTRQYLAFEQLRYEERLNVDLQVDPESFDFELPPFSMQTLAENAVHHAVAIRPQGGSICIKCWCADGRLHVTVRDNGTGAGAPAAGSSSQLGLRSVRERLVAAFGSAAALRVDSRADGFEASFVVPATVAGGDGETSVAHT